MSRFHRSGHWRTNQYGTTYWVSGHTVDRYEWDRSSASWATGHSTGATDLFGQRTARPSQRADGRIPSFTVPNARCPQCGALVFFYQNSAGSRVFFDDLGPPWPKHPCTDLPVLRNGGSHQTAVTGASRSTAPTQQNDADDLFSILLKPEELVENLSSGIAELTRDGWERCIVKKKTIRHTDDASRIYYVVHSALDPSEKSVRFSTAWRVPHPSAKDTVYLKDNLLSYFDFEIFEPREVEIERKLTKAGSATKRRSKKRKGKRKKK